MENRILSGIRISKYFKNAKRNPPFLGEGRSRDTIPREVKILDRFR